VRARTPRLLLRANKAARLPRRLHRRMQSGAGSPARVERPGSAHASASGKARYRHVRKARREVDESATSAGSPERDALASRPAGTGPDHPPHPAAA
jgi:hypothetical protein